MSYPYTYFFIPVEGTGKTDSFHLGCDCFCQVSSPTIIVERAGSYAWAHKSWRVREEFARTVTSAIGLFASTELPLQRAILPPVWLLTLF